MSRYLQPRQLQPGSMASRCLALVRTSPPRLAEDARIGSAATSGWTAAEVGEELGVSREVAQQTLSRMVGWGVLSAEGAPGCEQNGCGRRYRLAAEK